MAAFSVNIPDELLPGLVAELSTIPNAPSPEEYFQASAVELLRQRCQTYAVGPYWVGGIPPRFNQDGTPYQPPAPPAPEGDDTVAGGDQLGE